MLDMLMKRRSIRKFEGRPIPSDVVDKLVKAALLSPSSRSIDPWEFIVVTEKNLLAKLADAKEHGSSFLRNAPLGIVVIADGAKSDVWVEDCSIASILIQMAAETLGLGSCWIQLRKRFNKSGQSSEEYVKELFSMPEHYRVLSVIAVGYPAEKKAAKNIEELQFDKVHYERVEKWVK